MPRFAKILLLLTVVAGLAVPAALAGNAHFIKSQSGASISNTGALTCSFKESGLESGSIEHISCTGTASTTYECVNGGNKNPSASNKTTTQSTFALTGTFPADKNGNVVGSISGGPPSASDLGFSCPPGQATTFVSVTYSGLSIGDADTGASLGIAGSFSFTNTSAP